VLLLLFCNRIHVNSKKVCFSPENISRKVSGFVEVFWKAYWNTGVKIKNTSAVPKKYPKISVKLTVQAA